MVVQITMILGSTMEKKKHLCNYSAFLSLCCLPATHSLSYWNTLSCITAAIIGCTYMYGFSSKLHVKRFFSSTLGFHESTCTHRKSLTHKTDLYWITVSQAFLLLRSEQVERLINDCNQAYRDDELNEIRAHTGSQIILDSPVGFLSILWMRRSSFLKAKRSFHLSSISYLWGQCAGCLIGSVLPGAWRPVCRDGFSWHPEHPIKLWTWVRQPKSSGSRWGQRAFLCTLFFNYLCVWG